MPYGRVTSTVQEQEHPGLDDAPGVRGPLLVLVEVGPLEHRDVLMIRSAALMKLAPSDVVARHQGVMIRVADAPGLLLGDEVGSSGAELHRLQDEEEAAPGLHEDRPLDRPGVTARKSLSLLAHHLVLRPMELLTPAGAVASRIAALAPEIGVLRTTVQSGWVGG